MSFSKISINFFIIFQTIFSEIIFSSDVDMATELVPSSLVGGFRLEELQRTVIGYTSNMSYEKYMVSIREREKSKQFGFTHFCGGVILKDNLVLTAAHCVVK